MRSKLIFFLAIIMALITTGLFFNYMQQDKTTVAMEPSVAEVVVAKGVIDENQRVTEEMVEVAERTEKEIHPAALTDINDVEGKFATATMEAGEVILEHRLQNSVEENLIVSRKVQDGYRAVSVGVSDVQSVANLIEPEDYVDVIFSEIVKDDQDEEEIETEQLLSNVRVLAVGRQMTTATSSEDYVEYSSVTVELNEADASTLINASERGRIHFTLHSSILTADDEE